MFDLTKKECRIQCWAGMVALMLIMSLVSFDVMSEGTVYKGTKAFECQNPTERDDGQPILPGEIQSATMYVLDSALLGNVVKTVPMPGGCTRIEGVDITDIGFGQFYTSATFELTGGEVSVFADGVPFESRSAARPKPPVIVE